MFKNAEFCNMKNQKPQNASTISGIFVLLLGGLISSILLLLMYLNILHFNFEVVVSPFVVITLLTYGDKILVNLLIIPFSFFTKSIYKRKESSQTQQKQLTLKQS